MTNSIIFIYQNYKLRNLDEAKEALQVKPNDSRITQDVGDYLKLAIGSGAYLVFNWSAFEI